MPALTHSAPRIVQQLLINGGVGIDPSGTGDWKVYSHNVPEIGDNIIVVRSSPGIRDGRCLRTGEVTKHHGLQILTRGKTSEIAHAKALAIEAYLTEDVLRTAVTVDAATYRAQAINLTSDVIPLGQQEKNRNFMFSSNFTATISEV